MFPTLGDFLTYMKGLKPMGKVFGLFESYGWGGGAVKEMRKTLEENKFEVWDKECRVQYLPDSSELKNAFQFGRDFAKRVLGK
jgi:flavorubredoxin